MGFFGLLKSIEELLYEVMTWLVFYPRTLWRVIRHPLTMIDYSNLEQSDKPDEQYTDTLSPPLFLMLTILLAHGLELAFARTVEVPTGTLGKLFASSEEMLLLYRSVIFSIYPLMFAVALLKRSDQALDRNTLRQPFFSQCYLGALLALLFSIVSFLVRAKPVEAQVASVVVLALTIILYLALQAAWLRRHLAIERVRATWVAIGTFLKATFWAGVFGLVVTV